MKKVFFLGLLGIALTIIGMSLWSTKNDLCEPMPLVKEPLTDWNKFHKAVQDGKVYIIVAISVGEDEPQEYTIYLVDDERWYTVSHGCCRGCGPIQDIYSSIHSTQSLKSELQKPPSNSAKFVVVGPGKPLLREVKFRYK